MGRRFTKTDIRENPLQFPSGFIDFVLRKINCTASIDKSRPFVQTNSPQRNIGHFSINFKNPGDQLIERRVHQLLFRISPWENNMKRRWIETKVI